MKLNNKKKILLGSIIGILLGSLVSMTYAFFTYSVTSANQQLIAGDIYLRYQEGNGITLSNMLPSSTYPNEYFEFTVTGKNTNTQYDVEYNLKLAYGDAIQGKTRVTDSDIFFKLVEVVNNVEQDLNPAVEDESFNSIPDSIIYTGTIPKNTTNQETHTYRLYMRISDSVTIGNGDVDYQMSDWNNRYASVKINADGGLVTTSSSPSPVATDASCFTTNTETIMAVNYPLSSSALNSCVEYFEDSIDNPESFCSGSDYDTSLKFEAFFLGSSISSYDYDYFLEHNIVTEKEVISITDYDTSCGTDVVIPSTINSKDVAIIDVNAFEHQDESPSPKITSVYLPNTIKNIRYGAFMNNNITNLSIPESVAVINEYAFAPRRSAIHSDPPQDSSVPRLFPDAAGHRRADCSPPYKRLFPPDTGSRLAGRQSCPHHQASWTGTSWPCARSPAGRAHRRVHSSPRNTA